MIRTETVVGEDDGDGRFEITLGRVLRLRADRKYWVSVQANMNFTCCGFWRWDLRSPVEELPPMWVNPADGWDTGCVDWTPISTCRPEIPTGDLMFDIRTR